MDEDVKGYVLLMSRRWVVEGDCPVAVSSYSYGCFYDVFFPLCYLFMERKG